MSVAYQTLLGKYRQEDDEELLERYSAGTLTEDGYDALGIVLGERGIEIPDRPVEANESSSGEPRISRRWWFAIGIAVFVGWSIFWGHGRDERRDQAINNATDNIAGRAFEKYKRGKAIDQVEFGIAAQAIVDKTNKFLPKKIDEITTIKSVEIKNGNVLYNYVLDKTIKSVDPSAFRERVYKQIVPPVCNDAPGTFFLSHGADLVYAYELETGALFTKIVITKSDCVSS